MDAATAVDEKRKPNIEEFLASDQLSCRAILLTMADIDNGYIEATPEQMKELAKKLRDKTDAYYHVLEDIRAERAKLQMRIDMRTRPLQDEVDCLDRDERNLMKLLLWNMESNGLKQLVGDEYIVQIKEGRGNLKNLDEPQPVDKVKYPGLIRTKYEWDKTAVKQYMTEKTAEQIAKKEVDADFLSFSKRFKIDKSKKAEFKPNTKRNRK